MTSPGWLLPIGAGASGLGPPAKHSRAACSGAEKEERPTSHRGKSWCAPAQEAGEGGKGFRSPEPQEVTRPQAQATSVPPHAQMRREWYLLLSPAYLRDPPVSGTEMAWRLYMACGVLGVFFLATLWTGRGSPHSRSARPEQWPHTCPLLLLHLSHPSRLLSAPQPPPVPPKVLVASPHDRLFLEPFTHAHSFHHSPGTMEAFQPRSFSGSRPHFHLSPICHPLNSSDTQMPGSSDHYTRLKRDLPPQFSYSSNQKAGTALGTPTCLPFIPNNQMVTRCWNTYILNRSHLCAPSTPPHATATSRFPYAAPTKRLTGPAACWVLPPPGWTQGFCGHTDSFTHTWISMSGAQQDEK